MSHKYVPSYYNPAESLEIRYHTAAAQLMAVTNNMTEAVAARNYEIAEKLALELLRTGELAVRYFQQFTKVETVASDSWNPDDFGADLGDWNPEYTTNVLPSPHMLSEGDYYTATETYGDFRPGDRIVAQIDEIEAKRNRSDSGFWVRVPVAQVQG